MTAYKLMGFAGKSGSSATALGSARQYGLIEGTGEKTRVSELAMKILEPSSPQERLEGLIEAANTPDIFRAIYSRFEERVPASDEPIRAFLVRERGFTPESAEECIAAFRVTNDQLEQIRVVPREEVRPDATSRISPPKELSREQGPEDTYISLPLTRDCAVELRFTGRVSDRAIGILMGHIELMQDVWSES